MQRESVIAKPRPVLPPALPPSPALSHVHSNDVSGLSTAPPSPPASQEPQSASSDLPREGAGSEDGRSRTATFDEADEEDDDGEGDAAGEGGDAAAGGDRSGPSGGGGKQRGKKKGGKKGGKHQHGKDKKPPPPRDAKSTTAPTAVALVAAKATPVKSDAARHAEEEAETVRVCVAALDALGHPCALPPRRTGALRRVSLPPSGSRGNQSASPALSAAPAPWLSGGPAAAAQPPPPNFDPAELWATLVAWVVTYSHTNLYHGPFFQLLRAGLRTGHEPTLRHVLQSGRLVTTFVTHYVDSTPVPIAGGGGGGHHQQLRLPGFGLDAAEAAPPPVRMKTRAQRRAEASGARGTILRALNAVRLAAQVGAEGC